MSKEVGTPIITEVSSVHDIHDYCKFSSDAEPKQDNSVSSQHEDELKNGLLDEIIVPNIEAEEVMLETVIEESHVPLLINIKQEEKDGSEIITEVDDSQEMEHSQIEIPTADEEKFARNSNFVKKEKDKKTFWHRNVLFNDWTEGHVNLLIEVCEEFADELKINPRKVNVWKSIKQRMHSINSNFRKTYPRVYSQWRALVKQYRLVKRIMRKRDLDGYKNNLRTPPWFGALDHLLHRLNCYEWDFEYDSLGVNEEDDFAVSGDEFTSSPSLETVRRSKRRKFVSWKLKQPTESLPSDNSYLWDDTNIHLLISARSSCEGEFQHTERTYQDNWTLVQEKIWAENPNFAGSYLECADKWKSLIKAYHMVRAKRKVKPSLSWKWYDRMDQVLWSQSDSKNNISGQLGNATALNSPQPNTDVAHQVIVIQEDGTLIASTEEQVADLYTVITPETTPVVATLDNKDSSGNLYTVIAPKTTSVVATLDNKDSSGKLWNDQRTASLIRARGSCTADRHGRKKAFWKNVLKRMVAEDPTFTGTVEQCWSKWRNLQQTYNANKRRAETFGIKAVGWEWFTSIDKIVKGETTLEEPFTDHETGGAVSQVDSDDDENQDKSLPTSKLWTNKNIRLLLNVREECNELFTTSRSVQGVWQVIRDRIVAIDPSFPGSPTDCNDKFRNLLGTYRINKRRKDRLGREQVYWRWYDDMERIMKASQPRINLSKMADISDFEDDSNQLGTDCENLYFSDVEGVDDFSDKMWNGHNIKLLILCREEFHEQFAKNSKNNTWEKIRQRMIQLNPDFTGTAEDCSRKWRNLGTTYRQVKKRQQFGGESVMWPWFFLIDRYFTQKHGQNLDFLLFDEEVTEDSIGTQDYKSKRNDSSQPYNYWLKEYLIRREERDQRAEVREERMLNLMEQLLSLEKKKISSMNKIMSSGSSFEKSESNHNSDVNSRELIDSSPKCLTQENISIGPKTQRIHNLDTRAGLLGQVHSYSDREFKNNFRVSRDIFKILILNVVYSLDNTSSGGRPRLGKELALLMTLWLLGNGNETFRTTGVKFGISESTCYRIHKLVVKRIAEMNDKYIKWPAGDVLDAVRNGFNALRGDKSLPGVVGCVDGTHIAIKKQSSDPSYMNPNKHHSVILQACCDHKGLFLDVCAGWPGSYQDATVWRASPLYHALENDPDTIPSECHLVGDLAYPMSTYLMKPYLDDGNLNPKQQQYNEALVSTWEVIEGSFALLKARFGCLKKMLDSLDLDFIKDIIMACCVLHNICILEDDDNKYDITMDTTVELDSGLQHFDFENEPTDLAAELKRSALTELVWRKLRN